MNPERIAVMIEKTAAINEGQSPTVILRGFRELAAHIRREALKDV